MMRHCTILAPCENSDPSLHPCSLTSLCWVPEETQAFAFIEHPVQTLIRLIQFLTLQFIWNLLCKNGAYCAYLKFWIRPLDYHVVCLNKGSVGWMAKQWRLDLLRPYQTFPLGICCFFFFFCFFFRIMMFL